MLGIQQWTILGRFGAMLSRLWALLEALEWILGYLGKLLNDYTYVGCTERHKFCKNVQSAGFRGKKKLLKKKGAKTNTKEQEIL